MAPKWFDHWTTWAGRRKTVVVVVVPLSSLKPETILITLDRERSVDVRGIQISFYAARWRHHRVLQLKIRSDLFFFRQ